MAVAQVQQNKLSSASSVTSIVHTFTSTAVSDNFLITSVSVDKDGGTVTITESGWSTPVVVKSGTSSTLAYSYKVSDGTETQVTWNFDNHNYATWFGEYSGLATTGLLNVSAVADSGNSIVNFQTTGTTPTTTSTDTFAFGFWSIDTGLNAAGGPRLYSNSFTEVSYDNTSSSPGLATASKDVTALETVESTFDPNGSDQMCGAVAVFNLTGTTPPPTTITPLRRRMMS